MKFFRVISLLMTAPVYASSALFDNSVTYRFASSDAQIVWPEGNFAQFQKTNLQPQLDFEVADTDQERAIYLPLDNLTLSHSLTLAVLAKPGNKGVADFLSQEKNSYKAPQLTFTLQGNKRLLIAEIDTYIAKKDRKSKSKKPVIKAGGGHIGLLHFRFDEALDLSQVRDLQLVLTTTNRQFGKSKLQLARLQPVNHSLPVQQGIAEQFPLDAQISQHPSVYFADDFDQQSWFSQMKSSMGLEEPVWQNTGELNYVPHEQIYHFNKQPGYAVKMPFTTSANLAGNLDYYFAQQTGSEPEQAYFRYYSMLASDAYVSGGGKLPGFGGTYNKAGWGGRANNGSNGWSARGAFYQSVNSDNPQWASSVPIGSYIYEVDTRHKYGKSVPWGHPLSAMQPGKWYAIEQFLKLNTPGKKDGVLTVWIDGKQIYHRDNLHFRDTDKLKIEKIWFNYYFGGVAKPKKSFDMYLDNIVIASEYIGPIAR